MADVKEFVKLCKPKILVTFLFVFILSYLISCGCEPRLNELLMGTFGVLTSISGANILNNYYDRDLDARMIRTSRRPIPSGKIRPNVALAFGLFLTSVSLVISFYLGLIPLVILLAGFTSYILIYTIMAKRRFALSVFATAPAVASPVWFGWWLARGALDLNGFLTGLLMVFWGVPHFWSLAITYSKDYKRAELPILTVTTELKTARWHLIASGILLIAFSQALSLLNVYGTVYLILSSALNSILLFFLISLIRNPSKKATWRIFKFSSQYIIIILLIMLADRLIKI